MNEGNILDTEQLLQNGDGLAESAEVTSENVEVVEGAADPQAEQGEESGSAAPETVVEYVEVVQLPTYSFENPLPVTLVESEEELVEPIELEVFSLTGTYAGTISDTYLDYFEGIVQKLDYDEHYVIWRSGQYAYTMCYGEDIELNGTFFSGDCNMVQLYRSSDSYSNDWYVATGSDSLALSATDIFCYSDLGMYSALERGLSYGQGTAILVSIAVITCWLLAHSIFDYICKYIYCK